MDKIKSSNTNKIIAMKHNKAQTMSGIILYMRPANERRRYIVTSSLIGWMHTQNDPCMCVILRLYYGLMANCAVPSYMYLVWQAKYWLQNSGVGVILRYNI